jgi:hypothetical protein
LVLAFSLADCSRTGTNAERNHENISAARFESHTDFSISTPRLIPALNQLDHFF